MFVGLFHVSVLNLPRFERNSTSVSIFERETDRAREDLCNRSHNTTNKMAPLLLLLTLAIAIHSTKAFISPARPSISSNILHHHRTHRRPLTSRAPRHSLSSRLNLFGFGETKTDDRQGLLEGELARFSNLSSASNVDVKFDSLSIMIAEWSKLFIDNQDDKKKKTMGLTTPVTVVPLPKGSSASNNEDVVDSTGVQLLFQKGKGGRSAYQDKDDEKNETKEKVAPVKDGGVEVRVEKMNDGSIQVVASRCEIEEGTLIKEMSEETILESLRKAVGAWTKEQ